MLSETAWNKYPLLQVLANFEAAIFEKANSEFSAQSNSLSHQLLDIKSQCLTGEAGGLKIDDHGLTELVELRFAGEMAVVDAADSDTKFLELTVHTAPPYADFLPDLAFGLAVVLFASTLFRKASIKSTTLPPVRTVSGAEMIFLPLRLASTSSRSARLIMVFEFLWLERRRLLVDELRRKIQHFLLRLCRWHLVEEIFRLPQFIRVAEHFHHEAVPEWRNRDKPLATCDRDLAETHPVHLAERIANDDEAFAGQIVLRRNEIGPLEIPVVDLFGVNELHEVDRALTFELQRINLGLFKKDIGVGLDFVAFDDVLAIDRSNALNDALHVHAASGRLVDLVEGNLGLRLDG